MVKSEMSIHSLNVSNCHISKPSTTFASCLLRDIDSNDDDITAYNNKAIAFNDKSFLIRLKMILR